MGREVASQRQSSGEGRIRCVSCAHQLGARSGRSALDCDFIGGCRPGFPDASGGSANWPGWTLVGWSVGPIQSVVILVKFLVAATAYECQLVDVGFTRSRRVERREVVGLAACRVGATLNAAFVSGDQRSKLGGSCHTFPAAVEQHLAIAVEDGADKGRIAEQLPQQLGG